MTTQDDFCLFRDAFLPSLQIGAWKLAHVLIKVLLTYNDSTQRQLLYEVQDAVIEQFDNI